MSDAPIISMCVCSAPQWTCGGEAYPEDVGYCAECAYLDSEEHCPRCPGDCCTSMEAQR